MRNQSTDLESGDAPRLLVLAPQPFLEDRGTPIALKQVLEGLVEMGVAADVVTFPIGRDPGLPGVRVVRSANPFRIRSVPVGLSMRKLVLDLALAATAWGTLRRGRYVAVQASEEAAFLAVALGRVHRLPIIYDMQSSLPEQLADRRVFRLPPLRWLLQRCERWLARRVDMIITSAGLGAHARSIAPGTPVREWRFHAPSEPVPPASVASLRSQLGIPAAAPTILYTGTFTPYQGLGLLLRAIPRVLEAVPETVFVLVGADRSMADLDSRSRIPASAVRVIGRQARSEMRGYYALADAVVSPRASGRNLPLKVFDYLGAGKAIVATDMPAHRAVLDDALALLVPPEPEQLADGLLRILRDPDLRRRYEQAATAFARDNLGWDPFVRTLRDNYTRILELPVAGVP